MPPCHRPYHCRDRRYHRIIGDAAAIPRIDAAREIGWSRHAGSHEGSRERERKRELWKKGPRRRRRQRGGGREASRREGGTTEREKEHARLSADAADSTTGGGGLTAPLHIHPRYIDLSRPPPSSRLTSLLATLLSGTRAHQERSVESVPGAAALVSAIRRGWGIGDGSGGSGGSRGAGGGGGGEDGRGGGGDDGGGGAELT